MLRLNLGSFTVFYEGYLNIDLINQPFLYAKAAELGYQFMSMDVRGGLPFADGSVDYIFSSHMIEHLNYREAEFVMSHCHRVLRSGGVMRIGVPDLKRMVDLYSSKTLKRLDSINEPATRAKYDVERFWGVLTEDHKSAYDRDTLFDMCKSAGFSEARECEYNQGTKEILDTAYDMFPLISLYVECTK